MKPVLIRFAMSIEKSYIRNLTHKYRVAVAIAVLKQKPENSTTEEYIEQLKSKINNESEDLDLTVCSDDFILDENDINNDYRYFTDNDRIVINDPNNDNSTAVDISHNISLNQTNRDSNKNNSKNNGNITFKNTNDDTTDRTFNDNDRRFNDIVDKINDTDCHANDAHYNDVAIVNNINVDYTQNSESILKNYSQVEYYKRNMGCVNITSRNCAREHDYTAQPEEQPFNNEFSEKINFLNKTANNDISTIRDIRTRVVNSTFQNEGHVENGTETFNDSQATEFYTVPDFTQNYTHVSQSQDYHQIVTNNKFLKTANNNINPKISNESEIIYKSNLNNDFGQDITETHKDNMFIEDLNEDFISDSCTNNCNVSTLTRQNSMQTQDYFSQCGQNINEINIEEVDAHIENDLNETVQINEVEELSNDETEIVSFKVIEELNKVKNYINRRVERRVSNDGSMDSGYRSDSQKSCRSSLQPSSNWLNQSAHSLFEYISHCPLLGSTQEIVGEIALVLGQLVDKLHDEERYPSFLEELLDSVGCLLEEVLRGYSGEDVLIKKEETIQRLFLLNKSTHIQKYALEKITTILENLHTDITDPEKACEITNTDEVENLSYIFHILETLLQNFKQTKFSQESQSSQRELKKSSITDIWRKKWNPQFNEDNVIEDILPKKCVLLRCNEILNKLVVGCMDGYSLLAFSALQCFNVMQC